MTTSYLDSWLDLINSSETLTIAWHPSVYTDVRGEWKILSSQMTLEHSTPCCLGIKMLLILVINLPRQNVVVSSSKPDTWNWYGTRDILDTSIKYSKWKQKKTESDFRDFLSSFFCTHVGGCKHVKWIASINPLKCDKRFSVSMKMLDVTDKIWELILTRQLTSVIFPTAGDL